MAYSFDGVDDYIEGATAPVTAVPLTMASWFRVNVDQVGVTIALDTAASNSQFQAYVRGSVGGTRVAAGSVESGTNSFASSSTSYTPSVWGHMAAVFTSATSRDIYLDGGPIESNATSSTPTGINRVRIGARFSTSLGSFFSGLIAETAIWNAALTGSEIASLAKGISPRRIRPGSLRFYAPLVREAIDIVGGVALTVNGAVAADHPRIFS